MGIKKKYSSDADICKVTFTLPSSLALTAKKANVVGEFNDWDKEGLPMKKRKGGSFSASVELKSNKEYQFRYLVDGNNWATDPEADDFAPVPFANEKNSIVKV
jgi:1,4-alpha-glucan branching enzyme